jgi:Carboxypeptidase regulatory-like domain
MKAVQKFSLLLALALMFNWHATAADAAKFSGTIVDAQGNPVAGAVVECYQYSPRMFAGPMDMEMKQHVTADAQGAFEFPMFNGMAMVLATKDGFAPGWQSWYSIPQEPQKIVLNARATLAGMVVDDAGQPVVDAEVWVSSALSKTLTDMDQPNGIYGKKAQILFSARTSADGKFRIENFPAGAQAMLTAKKDGKAMRQSSQSFQYDELPYHAGQDDITLTLDPAGTVTGKIVAHGTGEPLANALVGVEPTSRMGYFSFAMESVVSAADGSFQISNLPAGSYQVQATFTNEPIADWVADSVPVKVVIGETAPAVQIQADKGGVLEITVRGKKNHEPLADVGVGIYNEDYNRGGSTGTNGVASFRLLPGQFSMNGNKQNWSPAQVQATVTEGQTTRVNLDLSEAFKISGVVRDASGAPVAGANVMVVPDYGGMSMGAKTDANGHYEVSWQKPSWAGSQNQSYFLIARQMERKLAAIQPMDEAATNLDVTLMPAMSVSGLVQDTKGTAVTNAVAYVQLHQENSGFSIGRRPVHSDAHGRIQVDALPMGERYGFYVSAKGYGSSHEEMDAADPKADHYDFPPLVVNIANRKLAGRVLGTNGAPAAGVQIWMNGEGQPNGNAITDENGRFAFDAVCDGTVSVSANMKGLNGSAQAMGGDTNVVIRFNANDRNYYAPQQASQTLTGTVYDSAGKPAVGVRVIVTPTWGADDIAKTDANGEYSVNWQPEPGMRGAKYFAIARDVEHNLVALEQITTNKNSLILRLAPGFTVSGTVQDTKGTPLIRANINLNMMAGNMGGMVEYEPIKLNADGAFNIPALPMGQQYYVYASVNGYGSAQKNIRKTQSQTNSLQLAPFKLKAADRLLAGQVLGADKKPLAGVQVNFNGNGQPNGNMTTDATGHFKFKVCDGPISIYAWAPSGSGRNSSGNAQARGGDTNVVVQIGAQQQQRLRPAVQREIPLKPRPWTLSALVNWPASHKTGAIILLSLQAAVLLGTAGGIFWFRRKRGRR